MGSSQVNNFQVEKLVTADRPLRIEIDSKTLGLIGESTLRLESMEGSESVSQLFDLQLELRGNDFPPSLSNDADPTTEAKNKDTTVIDKYTIDGLLGQSATVIFSLPVPQESDRGKEGTERYFNGIISDFTIAEPGVYRASLKPALWKASLTNRYFVYQNMSIEQVLGVVLARHGVKFDMHLDCQAIERVQDWFQAGETDLALIQRLMGKANIYYYFIHGKSSHVMKIANVPQYQVIQKRNKDGSSSKLVLKYTHTTEPELSSHSDTAILNYSYKKTLSTTGVDSLVIRSEAAWESDTIAGFDSYHSPIEDTTSLPFRECKVYQYGGSKGQAKDWSQKNWSMISAAATGLSGSSTSSLLSAGHYFSTTDDAEIDSPEYAFNGKSHKKTIVRPDLQAQEFVVMQVQHKMSNTEPYQNSFQATETASLITPFNIQNTQQGSVLGTVIASGGAVKPKGWKYREKNNFAVESHQDDDTEAPETFFEKGVFVQLATDVMTGADPVWVKLGQTMQTVPEVGVTVIVTRSNDESELPEIQSIVQSNGNKVIMPSGWTANTNVGSSYSTSYGDSKSIRFGLNSIADLEGAKAIIEPAYDTGYYKDSSYSQGGSYSHSTSESGASGLLSRSFSYGCTYSTFEGDITESTSTIGTSASTSVIGMSTSNSTIGTSVSDSVIGTTTSESTIGTSINNSTITTSSSDTKIGTSTSVSVIDTTTSKSTIGTSTSDSKIGISKSYTALGPAQGDIDNANKKASAAAKAAEIAVNTAKLIGGVTANLIATMALKTAKDTKDAAVEAAIDPKLITEDKAYSGYVSVSTTNLKGSSYSKNDISINSISDSKIVGQSKNTSTLGSSHTETTITGASYSKSTIGSSENYSDVASSYSHSTMGTTNSVSLIGATQSSSAIGASNTTSATGASGSQSAVGASVSVSAIGTQNSVSAVANSNSASVVLNGNSASAVLTGVDATKAAAAEARMAGIEANIGQMRCSIKALDSKI